MLGEPALEFRPPLRVAAWRTLWWDATSPAARTAALVIVVCVTAAASATVDRPPAVDRHAGDRQQDQRRCEVCNPRVWPTYSVGARDPDHPKGEGDHCSTAM
jgi:hypothetical protein